MVIILDMKLQIPNVDVMISESINALVANNNMLKVLVMPSLDSKKKYRAYC